MVENCVRQPAHALEDALRQLEWKCASSQVRAALSDERTFTLRGRFVFDFLTGLSKLDVASEAANEGVWVRIEDLRIEEPLPGEPAVVMGGDFTFKILGQRGRINPLQ